MRMPFIRRKAHQELHDQYVAVIRENTVYFTALINIRTLSIARTSNALDEIFRIVNETQTTIRKYKAEAAAHGVLGVP